MDSRPAGTPDDYVTRGGARPGPLPARCSAQVVGDGDGVHDVIVRVAGGDLAARGRVAMCAGAAVVDQVETDPAHRRLGLARFVMHGLEQVAAEWSASRVVLVATEEGPRLYHPLGWTVESEITAARVPDPS